MSWLFGRKKVLSKVPFPGEQEGALRFPTSSQFERIIEPEQLKEAVGMEDRPVFNLFRKPAMPEAPIIVQENVLHYVKLDTYKAILGELDRLKGEMEHLQGIETQLLSSEYNEESKFVKLRRAVRGIHDRLLQVDKILFKG